MNTIERYKRLNVDCNDTIAEIQTNGLDDIQNDASSNATTQITAICSEPITHNDGGAREIDESGADTVSNGLVNHNHCELNCDNININNNNRSPSIDEEIDLKECNLNERKAGGYLIAVHRKLSRQDTYFLSYHKSRPSLFGVPLLIPCYEDGTNKDLYCAVWIQVARLLSPLPSTPPDQLNHATDWYVLIGCDFTNRLMLIQKLNNYFDVFFYHLIIVTIA